MTRLHSRPRLADTAPILETDRIFLRRFEGSDRDALLAVFSDADARRFYPYMSTPEMADRWIDRNIERYAEYGFGVWALCLRSTEALVGDVG